LDLDEAKKLAKLANVTAVQLDADRDPEKLNYLVQSNDVIIRYKFPTFSLMIHR
jgi:hypothetical protein